MNSVSAATLADVSAIAELMQEMDEFYGDPERESAERKTDNIRSALFGDPPCAYALVARQNSLLMGFASYSFLWPAVGSTRSLYLKELYVRHECRKSGVGRLLMDGLFEVARNSQCSRVEWTTDEENSAAREFYAHLSVRVQSSKIFYRTVI